MIFRVGRCVVAHEQWIAFDGALYAQLFLIVFVCGHVMKLPVWFMGVFVMVVFVLVAVTLVGAVVKHCCTVLVGVTVFAWNSMVVVWSCESSIGIEWRGCSMWFGELVWFDQLFELYDVNELLCVRLVGWFVVFFLSVVDYYGFVRVSFVVVEFFGDFR